MRGQSEVMTSLFIMTSLIAAFILAFSFTNANVNINTKEIAVETGRSSIESIASILRTGTFSSYFRFSVYFRDGALMFGGTPYSVTVIVASKAASSTVSSTLFSATLSAPVIYYSRIEAQPPTFSAVLANVVNGPVEPLSDEAVAVFNINETWGVVILPVAFNQTAGTSTASIVLRLPDSSLGGSLGWGYAELYRNYKSNVTFTLNFPSKTTGYVLVTVSSGLQNWSKNVTFSATSLSVKIGVDKWSNP